MIIFPVFQEFYSTSYIVYSIPDIALASRLPGFLNELENSDTILATIKITDIPKIGFALGNRKC